MNISHDVLELIRDWRDIEGFPNYKVSRIGEVRSIDRWVTYKDGRKRFFKGQAIKPHFDKLGYLYIGLSKNGKQHCKQVHRLVAQAFIPNPNNLPEVNHIDENPSNDFVWNLEWVDHKTNMNHGTANKRRSETQKGKYKNKNGKKVLCIELNIIFDSTADANEYLGKDRYSDRIAACCRGKHKTAWGYHWKYI